MEIILVIPIICSILGVCIFLRQQRRKNMSTFVKICNKSLDCIYIDLIMSSQVVEESYYDVNKEMVNDIYLNPHKLYKLKEA